MRHIFLILLWATLVSSCKQTSPPVSKTPQPQAAKQKAQAAFGEFSTQLKGELQQAMKLGGPVKAIEVCSEKAPLIAEELSQKHGFSLGRSSHRLRNPNNAPADAVAAYLKKYAEQPAKNAEMEVIEKEGEWVVIAPIATQPLCLTCHGSPDTFSAELKSALSQHYPEDAATGFEAGDLRGVIWARLPQEEKPTQ